MARPCKACGRPIKLIPTEKGWQEVRPKMMPLDDEPNPEGNVVILPAEGAIPPRARVLKKPPDGQLAMGEEVRYMPHWKTCSAPSQFRRRR